MEFVGDEMNMKYNILTNEIQTEIVPFTEFMSVSEELAILTESLNQWISNNDFYLRDIITTTNTEANKAQCVHL